MWQLNDLKWPKWAPLEAIEFYRVTPDKTSPCVQMFARVLTEHRAKFIWNELKSKNIPIDYFSLCLINGLEGSFYVNKTKKQYQEYHQKIQDQANALSELLSQSTNNLGVFVVDEKLSCNLSSCKHRPTSAAICRMLKKPEIRLSKTHYST